MTYYHWLGEEAEALTDWMQLARTGPTLNVVRARHDGDLDRFQLPDGGFFPRLEADGFKTIHPKL